MWGFLKLYKIRSTCKNQGFTGILKTSQNLKFTFKNNLYLFFQCLSILIIQKANYKKSLNFADMLLNVQLCTLFLQF